MIPVAVDRWKTHLTWNTNVIVKYAEIMRLFFSTKTSVDGYNYNMAVKHQLWPFTVMQFVGAAQGALSGTQNTSYSGENESSGGGGGSAPAAAPAQQPATTFAFTLQNDPMGFGESFARQLIDQLNSTQRNGGQIRGVLA